MLINGLSDSFVWAKTTHDELGNVDGWLPLRQHLDDTMSVAHSLAEHWISPQAINRMANELPGEQDTVRLASWLAGVHDIGKASPAFACQVDILADRMRDNGFRMHPRLSEDKDRRAVNHSLVGHWTVREWLTDELSFDFKRNAQQWGSVVGSHHGMTPDEAQLAIVDASPTFTGHGIWHTTRQSLLLQAARRIGGAHVLERYRDRELSLPTQVLLVAIVIVSDWIASNSDLFPLLPLSAVDVKPDDAATAERARDALAALNLPQRWVAEPFDGDIDRLFRERFGGRGRSARPVQAAAVRAAVRQAVPGLLIVEAPMGSGKTEAALMAAEVMAARSGADGVFVALPTQATTDAMYSRVREWLGQLPSVERRALSLAHGKAHLNDEHAGLVRDGRFAAATSEDAVVAHWWLSGRKKSMLAQFVVGTIDQLLFGALKSRHVMLRHLALAGKVVVIDEVHAYDVYMSQYLHRILHWLGAYGVPVVLLSATLPSRRRAELLRAYESGTGGTGTSPTEDPGYPVVTGSAGVAPELIEQVGDSSDIAVDRLPDDLDTLVAYLRTHLADGGCAAVVRNTVGRVQETAERLSAEFGEDAVTITHSRFLACDRMRIDTGLVRRFGPPSAAAERPKLHIVVASQVLEQSLDVDFDLMVTDLAPMDLVLQRLGRLHRHTRSRPDRLSEPRCAVVGVDDWTATPVPAVAGSRRVYGEHLLLRAAALLHDQSRVRVPDDIAPLVQRAYGDEPLGPASWQAAMSTAAEVARAKEQERVAYAQTYLLGEADSSISLVSWLRAGVGDVHEDSPQGMAQVRDGAESLEVLVVQRDAGGGLLTPNWLPKVGRQQIPLLEPVPVYLARVIAACTLRLPLALSHGGVIDAVIAELEENRFAAFEASPYLKGQLVLPLDDERQAVVHGYRLIYDLRRGLIHERV
ncbi:CRISPR-associated helicase Cas3' [Amycolatopsis sp. NPDC059657]|uniref:CRISPR-associated helicase Cas3' n=1 Tax=Amycolatopsis sp. NPDC059657 TaxID=3346899 RepID=UPI003672B900